MITVDKKPVVNAQATEAAREKQERIKERFKEWIWSDDRRRERLVPPLQRHIQSHARPHVQRRPPDVARRKRRRFNFTRTKRPASGASCKRPTRCSAHVVGAGKTYTMVAAAMELKRLGLARKPMFAVPNHMLGQFSTELLTLYPGANILVAGKEDFEKQNRKKLVQPHRHRQLGCRHRHAFRL